MLGDGSRGAILEMTLSKILYMSSEYSKTYICSTVHLCNGHSLQILIARCCFPTGSTQIIGMSATLGNVRDLQTFLNAENYSNDFRPVRMISV